MVGNIIDYLEWYGRFGFDVLPFNEVDNLILAEVPYARIDGIIPVQGDNVKITAKAAAVKLMESDVMKDCCHIEHNSGRLLYAMGASKRYGNALLYNHVNKHDFENQEQFAALHIDIDDGTTYVSFCGTDDTILGWKEDFNMAYQMPVPAQTEAVKYIEETLSKDNGRPIRVGGHSKGGNLAIYASMKCSEDITKRIINIYNNDGPGFMKSVTDSSDYLEIAGRIQTIVPENSIIGMLLEHCEEYDIVKSTGKGIMQHDGFNWQVCTDSFVKLEERSKDSQVIDETVTGWLATMDDAQRMKFIDSLYELLTKAGVEHLSEIQNHNPAKMNSLIKEMAGLEADTARMLSQVMTALIKEYGKNMVKGMNMPSISLPGVSVPQISIPGLSITSGNKKNK